MKAMILAAGEGTRLRPLTNQLPKALIPLAGLPLIQFTLRWLRQYGIGSVAINLHHLGEKIVDSCGDGSSFGLQITYSPEEVLLGTAGGVKKMGNFLGQTFVVVYGDILTNFNLKKMIEFHELKGALATIAVHTNPHPEESGVLHLNQQGQVIDFVEKPLVAERGCLVNGGIYVLEKEILDYIPDGTYYDFGGDVFPRLLESGIPVYGHVLSTEEYLIDIGTWRCLRQADGDMKLGKISEKELGTTGHDVTIRSYS
ncbi:MAG: hypothetical protein A2Y72_01010 [Chloroflexi bacterium RBG_13_53_26]|nr:MAG: hypothetical protein A2Y72_01010 [Chloroflexi bacterium RBG_13_53_26]